MSKEAYDAVMNDLSCRKPWEDRQMIWYEMRHFGLRRKFKPFASAADLHYPLADTYILKYAPYYYAFLYASETLAWFFSLQNDSQGDCSDVARWFDSKVKQNSNLETEALPLINHFLMSGKSVMKTLWNPNTKRLQYSAVNPTFFVVPKTTGSLQEADRCAEVLFYSKDLYKRQSNFNQDKAFIQKITGAGTERPSYMDVKYKREGISQGKSDDDILVWQVYEQQADQVLVRTFSPCFPTEPVAPTIALPYEYAKYGMVGNKFPFTEFMFEHKEGGYYSSRGIVELVAPIEAQLCKLLNEMSDFGTMTNRPIYFSEGNTNTANMKLVPGQVVNQRIESVQQQGPTLGWNDQIGMLRQLAQDRVGLPDAGLGNNNTMSDSKTAAESNYLASVASQVTELKGRIFRSSLGQLFQQSWALLMQFDQKSLSYFWKDKNSTIDEAFLHGEYRIEPTGSNDNVNKQFMMQKAIARKQMFAGDPTINQVNLNKSVLTIDDPRLVKELILDPNAMQGDQAEEQAKEMLLMTSSYPCQINPQEDDHMIHLQTLVKWVTDLMRRPEMEERMIRPDAAALMLVHGQAHLQMIQQSPGAKKLLEPMSQQLGLVTGYLKSIADQMMSHPSVQGQQPQVMPFPPQPQAIA
jgi:hypothetical protein